MTEIPNFIVFNLDDGVIVWKHDILGHILHFMSSTETKSSGLFIDMGNCSAWWPTGGPQLSTRVPGGVAEELWGSHDVSTDTAWIG